MGMAPTSTQLQTTGSGSDSGSTAQSGTGFFATVGGDLQTTASTIGKDLQNFITGIGTDAQVGFATANGAANQTVNSAAAAAKAAEWATILTIVGIIIVAGLLVWQAPKFLKLAFAILQTTGTTSAMRPTL